MNRRNNGDSDARRLTLLSSASSSVDAADVGQAVEVMADLTDVDDNNNNNNCSSPSRHQLASSTSNMSSDTNETPVSRFRRDVLDVASLPVQISADLFVNESRNDSLEDEQNDVLHQPPGLIRRSKSSDCCWNQDNNRPAVSFRVKSGNADGSEPAVDEVAFSESCSDTTWQRPRFHSIDASEIVQKALLLQQQLKQQQRVPTATKKSGVHQYNKAEAACPSEQEGRDEQRHRQLPESSFSGRDQVSPDASENSEAAEDTNPLEGRADVDPITSCRSAGVLSTDQDEKQQESGGEEVVQLPITTAAGVRKARFAVKHSELDTTSPDLTGCTSSSIRFTESDVNSVDGLPWNLQHELLDETHSVNRDQILQRLDGMKSLPVRRHPATSSTSSSLAATHRNGQPEQPHSPGQVSPRQSHEPSSEPAAASSTDSTKQEEKSVATSFLDAANSALNYYMFGVTCSEDSGDNTGDDSSAHRVRWKNPNDTLALLGCAPVMRPRAEPVPVPTSLVRVTSEPPPPSYAETICSNEVDPRMQAWVENQFSSCVPPPKDGSYHLGRSRTVIVHEIVRRAWTWCTAWSPSGDLLAVATENHHLAIIDTQDSIVWRIRHDKKIRTPRPKDTTQSIRAVAWGDDFIAVGGTGNAVTILAPTEPYQELTAITGTGFVGSLDWRGDSGILAIGTRLDKAMIVRVKELDTLGPEGDAMIESQLLYEISHDHWVNCVAFSPGGSCLAVGDGGGTVCVYDFVEEPANNDPCLLKSFKMEDSVLAVEWSPDGKFLYTGGEDFTVSVIDTIYWEVVHKIRRDRWVQCIASSRSGSHMAVGGVSSEISLLDMDKGWDSDMGIGLNGLVPLSAKWHPKDQFLAITGQNNSILVVETTNARHVAGHHLHSVSPILAIEFSPDGRMAIIGNESGVVTFYSLAGSTFVTVYELVVLLGNKLSIQWSLNGLFVVIGTGDSLIVVGRKTVDSYGKQLPPSASGFSVRKVVRDLGEIRSVSIDPQSQYVAVSGQRRTKILDATADFAIVQEFRVKETGMLFSNAWSPDGRWFATIGEDKVLTIYDTEHSRLDRWRAMFSLQCDFVGTALAWGPSIVGDAGLLYLAYGGDGNEINVMEIRTIEGTWELVLRIRRGGAINDLDWNTDGLLAAAIGNGTVSVIDLAYLVQSDVAVCERDYDWQRQALTCFVEIRRNRGQNSMSCTRWIPSAPGSDGLLALGGTDGELEIVDLTERRRCRGYVRGLS